MNDSADVSLLTKLEINPTATPIASIVWLHGLGADGEDFVPVIQQFKLPEKFPIRFIFPSAPLRPVTMNHGYVMRAWYDIVSLDFNQRADEKSMAESVNYIEQLIENEIQRGIPSDKIILAGFSQGAVIALLTGLHYSKPLAGIIALSGYLPTAEKNIAATNPANQSTPIFLAHGTEDTIVPYVFGELIHDTLKKYQHPTTWHSYAMPHSVCSQEIKDIAHWIQARFPD